MIRLRPHHLLCALTFVGEGYSDSFVANFRAIVARIAAGERIAIVAGPDDVCAPRATEGDAHCSLPRIVESDALTARSLQADEELRAILAGGALDSDRLMNLRRAFSAGTIRAACHACSWHALCTTVAASGYESALLAPSA